LRWAGSKKNLLPEIKKIFPIDFSAYHEPFLGSGAIFFNLVTKRPSYLSDSNHHLINAFSQLKYNVEDIISLLRSYSNNEEFYYYIRNNKPKTLIESASQFIFLNRTCYNGLYRVNQQDSFNVPYGKRKNVDFVTENLLRQISTLLKDANLGTNDFEETLPNINANDLVFIDPPYVVSHNENGFIEYNKKIFTWDDQIRLKRFILNIIEKDAYYILTNAAHESIKNLYSDIAVPYELKRLSKIGGKNAYRGMISEYLFSNISN